MNEFFQTQTTDHKDPNLSAGADKSPWQQPDMVYLGKLGDLVKGGPGKTFGSFDSDPNGNQQPKPKS
jgi:hypothetical protein